MFTALLIISWFLRHNKEVIESEFNKEYKRVGMPLRGQEFLDPEIAVEVSQRWMMKHVTQGPDGFILPIRVRHPGKDWIALEAKKWDNTGSHKPSYPPINFFAPEQSHKGKTGTVPTEGKDDKTQEKQQQQDEFKILYRDGGHRLLRLSFLGKSLGDVPSPTRSNFKIVVFEGRQVLSAKGGAEMYDRQEYMDVLMPPKEDDAAAGPGSTGVFISNVLQASCRKIQR